MRGALRIVGIADVNRPIAALSIAVLGRAPAVPLTPVAAGTAVVVDLGPAATIRPADQGVSGVLRLELVISAPGTYTFDSAVVLYRDPTLDVASA
jgi:hypothetical protein